MADIGWFDMGVVAQMVESHARGAHDHSQPLWQLVMFDAFLRNSLGVPAAVNGQAKERAAA
jgi:asparagine synthase (glutamine-hydrolysing)